MWVVVLLFVCLCVCSDDPDELEMYGSRSLQKSGIPSVSSFQLSVCDSILNIGPVVDVTIAQPAFRSVRPHPLC